MENSKIDKIIDIIRNHIILKEEGMIANNIGDGKVSGTPQADPANPPVFLKKKKRIYLGIGSRRKWMKPKN